MDAHFVHLVLDNVIESFNHKLGFWGNLLITDLVQLTKFLS